MYYISKNPKKAAMYFGIPIYLIERKYYKEVPYEPWNNMIDQSQEEYGSTGMHM